MRMKNGHVIRQITTQLEQPQYASLVQIAAREGVSIMELVRALILERIAKSGEAVSN